jgi:hypothetical protein
MSANLIFACMLLIVAASFVNNDEAWLGFIVVVLAIGVLA